MEETKEDYTTVVNDLITALYEENDTSQGANTASSTHCKPVENGTFWWPAVFCEAYFPLHGYIAVVLCTYGLLSNIFTVIIFSRPGMKTPVNVLLTAIAVADSLTMIPYIPYAIYFYMIVKCVKFDCASQYSHFWVVYMLTSNRLFLTFHNIAIWLTVALSIIRWISVCHHIHAKTLCSMKRIFLIILTVASLGIIICIPTYLEFKVQDYGTDEYWLNYMFDFSTHLLEINFIAYGAILRIVPCVVMISFCAPIIMKIAKANKTRERMKLNERNIRRADSEKDLENSNEAMALGPKKDWKQTMQRGLERIRSSRSNAGRRSTTIMLVTIVLFFVSVEMPIGLVCLVSGFNRWFSDNVYTYMGDLQDDLVLLNSAVNFTLYCLMSAQFRRTCIQVLNDLRKKIAPKSRTRPPTITLTTSEGENRKLSYRATCMDKDSSMLALQSQEEKDQMKNGIDVTNFERMELASVEED